MLQKLEDIGVFEVFFDGFLFELFFNGVFYKDFPELEDCREFAHMESQLPKFDW